uniref:Uncharacterized protein n=1 Tax=viral metagenome TaxID=1070528 RepID=A0A6C0BFM0_9ZZZZ
MSITFNKDNVNKYCIELYGKINNSLYHLIEKFKGGGDYSEYDKHLIMYDMLNQTIEKLNSKTNIDITSIVLERSKKLIHCIYEYELSLKKKLEHDKKATILTLYQGGRGGDIGYAKLIIKYLITYQGFKKENINIVIHNDGTNKELKLDSAYFNDVNYSEVDGKGLKNVNDGFWTSYNEDIIEDKVINLIKDTDYCILVPNWYRYSLSQIDQLIKLNKPIYRFTEYDFNIYEDTGSSFTPPKLKRFKELEGSNTVKLPVQLGFGKSKAGILINTDMIYKEVPTNIQELQELQKLQKLQEKYSIFVCYQHLPGNIPDYVYMNNIGNIITMVDILKTGCTMITNKIIIFWADADEKKISNGEYNRQSNIVKQDATIINLEKFNNSSISTLDTLFDIKNILIVIGRHHTVSFNNYNSVAIFSVATGNQSFAELLINGKLAIYDISRWNALILPNLVETIQSAGLQNLKKFYEEQNCSKTPKQQCINYLKDVLCDKDKYDELVKEAIEFAQYLIKEKNFNSFDFFNFFDIKI